VLAIASPFLLLRHKFCREVLEAIRMLSAAMPASLHSETLFRGRVCRGGQLADDPELFGTPPVSKVGEGRYNHAGHPVLYAASSVGTCYAELGEVDVKIMEFRLHRPLRLLDLTSALEDNGGDPLLNALAFSSLASEPRREDGWYQPQYVFSRFVADCAKASGFDAIRYPSTRESSDGVNIAVLSPNVRIEDPCVAELIGFYSVIDGTISPGKQFVRGEHSGAGTPGMQAEWGAPARGEQVDALVDAVRAWWAPRYIPVAEYGQTKRSAAQERQLDVLIAGLRASLSVADPKR
jgi:hypothetical protein